MTDTPNEVVEVEIERLRREAYSRTVDYQRAMSMLERAAHELAAARAVVDAARNVLLETANDYPPSLGRLDSLADALAAYDKKGDQMNEDYQLGRNDGAIDERARIRATVGQRADRAYCTYADQMRRADCLGSEAKLRQGQFGSAQLKAHTTAAEYLGAHRALMRILAAIDGGEST